MWCRAPTCSNTLMMSGSDGTTNLAKGYAMRTLALIVGIGMLVVAASGCEDLFEDSFILEDDFRFTEPENGLVMVDVRTYNGSVNVRGAPTDEINVVATRYIRTTDETDGRRYAEDVEADVRLDGDTLVVRTILPIGRRPSHIDEVRVDIDILMPAGMELRIETDDGAVEARDIDDDARIRTGNGSVAIEGLAGSVDARTSNGAVDASFENLAGPTMIRTNNGAIDVLVHDKSEGTISLESNNGSVDFRARQLLAPADLRTSNGAVTLVVERTLEADIEARTSNGGIDVRLPFGASFNLAASTSSGTIDTEWGRSDGFLEIEVNGGAHTVELESSLGAIDVSRG